VAKPCHAAIVRSPHAHARILGYDVAEALAMPGVVGIITGEDVAKSTKPFSVGVTAPVQYYCAATDRARFVGEPVAVVVARDRYLAEDAAVARASGARSGPGVSAPAVSLAEDAADGVVVRYEPLPVVVDPERALEPD